MRNLSPDTIENIRSTLGEEPDNLYLFSFYLTALLPFGNLVKVQLLKSTSLAQRLRIINTALRSCNIS